MRFHDPEVDRVLDAAEQARERLAAAIADQPPERSDRATEHATDAILALVPTAEGERHEWARDTCSDCGTPLETVVAQNAGRCQSCLFKRL